jgi:hypothetical protein
MGRQPGLFSGHSEALCFDGSVEEVEAARREMTRSGNFGRAAAITARDGRALGGNSRIALLSPPLHGASQSAICFKVFSRRAQSRRPETSPPHSHGVMFNAHRTGDRPCI